MTQPIPWLILQDATLPDGTHRMLKALVRPHRVTVRMNESTTRGVLRTDIVTLTPEAMDTLVEAWQRVRTPSEPPACNHHNRKTEHTYDYCVDCGAHFPHDSQEREDGE